MARFAASLFAACLAVSILGASADAVFAQAAPRPPLPVIRHGKLAAKQEHAAKKEHLESAKKKKEHRESAEKRQKRAECREQAEKLISDADRRAYIKECMSSP
jgi:hypothetical protein